MTSKYILNWSQLCFILHILHFSQSNGETIQPTGDAECELDEDCVFECFDKDICRGYTLTCHPSNLCSVICDGDSACREANIIWPSTPGLGSLSCNGNDPAACELVTFPIPDPNQPLTITCDANSECQGATIHCPTNSNCTVQCIDAEACDRAIIHWPHNQNVPYFSAQLVCNGFQACRETNFPIPHPNIPLTISCDDEEQCRTSTIYCPENATCTVRCTANSVCRNAHIYCPRHAACKIVCNDSSADQMCQDLCIHGGNGYPLTVDCIGDTACLHAIIYAQNTSSLTINNCNGPNGCQGMTLWLPKSINGAAATTVNGGASFEGDSGEEMNIYAINGLKDINIIGYTGGFGDNDYINVHCLDDYSVVCSLADNTGQWECDPNGDITCNNPPTNAPTTSEPTTNNPTTYSPTTLQPTTNEPTTIIPTTSDKPTSIPTFPPSYVPTVNPSKEGNDHEVTEGATLTLSSPTENAFAQKTETFMDYMWILVVIISILLCITCILLFYLCGVVKKRKRDINKYKNQIELQQTKSDASTEINNTTTVLMKVKSVSCAEMNEMNSMDNDNNNNNNTNDTDETDGEDMYDENTTKNYNHCEVVTPKPNDQNTDGEDNNNMYDENTVTSPNTPMGNNGHNIDGEDMNAKHSESGKL